MNTDANEIKDVFDTTPLAINTLLTATNNELYVIPRFQRQYTWKEDNIDKLFTDVVSTFNLYDLKNDQVIYSFIGAMILTKPDPKIRFDKLDTPLRPQEVIDGQQRISTILLVLSILYFYLVAEKKNIQLWEKAEDDGHELKEAILKLIDRKLKELRNVLWNEYSDDIFLPHLIRHPEDHWGESGDSSYKSDVTRVLWETIKSITEKDLVQESRQEIEKIINKIIDGSETMQSFKDHKQLTQIKKDLETVFKGNDENDAYFLNEEVIYKIICSISDPCKNSVYLRDLFEQKPGAYKEIITTLRAVAFTEYFLNGVVVTVIRVGELDYAYNIFESLNTSGMPLTVLDTFYAKVTYELDHDEKTKQEIKNEIDEKIKIIRGEFAWDVHDLVSIFALSYYAQRVSSAIVEQRRFLNSNYDNSDNKLDFISRLYNAFLIFRDFRFKYTQEGAATKTVHDYGELESKLEPIDKLCIDLLCGSMPTAFAVLVPFYARLHEDPKSDECLSDFTEGLRMLASFLTLVRLHHNYRAENLLRKIYMVMKEIKGSGKEITPDLQAVRKSLDNIMINEGIYDNQGPTKREYWAGAVAENNNLYSSSGIKPLTRFMLLILRGGAVCQMDSYLLSLSNKKLEIPMAFFDYTIEHVAPQSGKGDWDQNIYKQDRLNRLGNLMTLPSSINMSIKDHDFIKKYSYARSNYCEDEEQFKKLLEDCGGTMTDVHHRLRDKPVEQSFDVLIMVHKKRGDNGWDQSLIDERGLNMAELAYDILLALFNNNLEGPLTAQI